MEPKKRPYKEEAKEGNILPPTAGDPPSEKRNTTPKEEKGAAQIWQIQSSVNMRPGIRNAWPNFPNSYRNRRFRHSMKQNYQRHHGNPNIKKTSRSNIAKSRPYSTSVKRRGVAGEHLERLDLHGHTEAVCRRLSSCLYILIFQQSSKRREYAAAGPDRFCSFILERPDKQIRRSNS